MKKFVVTALYIVTAIVFIAGVVLAAKAPEFGAGGFLSAIVICVFILALIVHLNQQEGINRRLDIIKRILADINNRDDNKQ